MSELGMKPVTPAGGWPLASVVVDLYLAESPEDAAAGLCQASRRLGMGCTARVNGKWMRAWPHQDPEAVLCAFDRNREPEPAPGEKELWVDGKRFLVPHAVWAHVQYLMDTAQHLGLQAETARAGVPMPPESGRWTKALRQAIWAAVLDGRLSADRACSIYGCTTEELDEWSRL